MSLTLEQLNGTSLPLLLTHLHIDHVLGIPLCPFVMQRERRLEIYCAPRGGVDARAALSRLFSRPLWPIRPEDLPAELVFHDLPRALDIGAVHIETMEGVHPDGVTLFRLTGGGRSVVLITDCTVTDAVFGAVARFAEGCDLLLCDGQYSAAEWPSRSGFGHNTWITAASLAKACGAKQARVLHHDATHGDDILDEAEREVRAICPVCSLAVQGEVIPL